MTGIILLFVIIIISISVFFTNEDSGKINNNILLSIRLPYSMQEEEEVKNIKESYKISSRKLTVLFTALALPILIATKYPSFLIIYLFIWIGLFFYFNNRVFMQHFNKLLSLKKKESFNTEEDECWAKGGYCNPKDKRLMVPKRMGYGYTLNTGNKKGKYLNFFTYASITALLVFLSFMFISFDTASFKLSINNSTAEISAPVYSYSFSLNEVKTIDKIDKLPKGVRTNGVGTEAYSLGNYNLNTYGKSKMYVYRDNPPYIVITLEELTVFLNGKTPEETEALYNVLKNNLK
ncbi:DUF5808 domain-containing protein [Clostridium polynesiense]|uniref:DUF5808 domain-containing protein n=1 Tax=Clostridium polynesiense TaxID=1325933 RepID=UPI00058BE55E|nr:DUF5808 domain-containing protein [Clostridium polynesiense]